MKKLFVILVALCAATCATTTSSPDATVLMDADRAFANDSAARGAAAWEAVFAENAVKPAAEGKWIIGAKAVGEQMSGAFRNPDFRLEWHPVRADLSRGGNLGYTWGRWKRTAKGKVAEGNYMTVWEKQKDGAWKVLFDTGDADPQP
jgi:ketosteroid isomerase-like protein